MFHWSSVFPQTETSWMNRCRSTRLAVRRSQQKQYLCQSDSRLIFKRFFEQHGKTSESKQNRLHQHGAQDRQSAPDAGRVPSDSPPSVPRRETAGNIAWMWDESGREVRASSTFKAVQRARNPPTACSLSVQEDRTLMPALSVRETHTPRISSNESTGSAFPGA